jgi:hypothetical protein
VNGGFAKGTTHNVLLKPADGLVDFFLALGAGDLERFVAKRIFHAGMSHIESKRRASSPERTFLRRARSNIYVAL